MSSVVSFLLLHVVFALSRHDPDAQNTACARSGGIGTPLVYGALKVIKARDRQARIEARLASVGLISDTRHRYSAVPGIVPVQALVSDAGVGYVSASA